MLSRRRASSAFANAILVAVGAVAPASAQSTPKPQPPDSIVLERTLCFGTCPAYRLSLTRNGRVSFESRNPGDSGRVGTDRIPSQSVEALHAIARELGFTTLPDTIARSRTLCPDRATDHPTATVTIFQGASWKRVVDYRGCFAASDHSTVTIVGKLRAFEAAIDSVAGSARWVRPARRR